ncbi:MAG: nucleoside triphosphate pyrophosphohydrolase [Spirochaetaceae bacterium]|jgi:tetrapyrrole methylase family protein/MazG family protein|nr:nucleoside triphosphate pyrophosphohydrolase [Spirochaetaceae bacterium]
MTKDSFEKLYGIVKQLRSPEGCPWDREQNPSTLRGDLLEECYECVEAIGEGDPAHVKEELGDVFLLVTMISYMFEQEGHFTVAQAIETVCQKLIRRHPHVFGDTTVKDSAEVLQNWAKIKVEIEGRKPKTSILDEVSRSLPPLERAYKLQKKAAKVGFDWDNTGEVFAKIHEELNETQEALREAEQQHKTQTDKASSDTQSATSSTPLPSSAALEGELGDLLFSVINLCRFLHIDPALALQRTNAKFTNRFSYVEKRAKESNTEMTHKNIAAMNEFWNEAKQEEKE